MNTTAPQNIPALPELHPGENIVWEGAPGKQNAPKSQCAALGAIGLVICGVVLWTFVADPAALPEWVPVAVFDALASTFARAFLLIFAIAAFLYPFIVRKMLRSMKYVVTDRRLVSCATWPRSGSQESIFYSDVQGVRVLSQGDSLSTLHIWRKPGAERPTHDGTPAPAIAFPYLPDEVAQYVSNACTAEIPGSR